MWSYNYNVQNELYHYGVLGMKWGHRKNDYRDKNGRLTKRGQKRQEYRDNMVKNTEASINYNKKQIEYNKKALADISKNGKSSKYVNEYYRNEYGPLDNEKTSKKRGYIDKNTGWIKDFNDLSKNQRKDLRKEATEKYGSDILYSKEKIKKGENIIKNIKNTPLGKTSYAEASKRRNIMTLGGIAVGSVLGYKISKNLYKQNDALDKFAKGYTTLAGGGLGGMTGTVAGNLMFNPDKYLKKN